MTTRNDPIPGARESNAALKACFAWLRSSCSPACSPDACSRAHRGLTPPQLIQEQSCTRIRQTGGVRPRLEPRHLPLGSPHVPGGERVRPLVRARQRGPAPLGGRHGSGAGHGSPWSSARWRDETPRVSPALIPLAIIAIAPMRIVLADSNPAHVEASIRSPVAEESATGRRTWRSGPVAVQALEPQVVHAQFMGRCMGLGFATAPEHRRRAPGHFRRGALMVERELRSRSRAWDASGGSPAKRTSAPSCGSCLPNRLCGAVGIDGIWKPIRCNRGKQLSDRD